MSYVAWIIVALLWLTVFISLFVSVGRKLSWLDFLYVFSYIKLVVTLIKYIPQVHYTIEYGRFPIYIGWCYIWQLSWLGGAPTHAVLVSVCSGA